MAENLNSHESPKPADAPETDKKAGARRFLMIAAVVIVIAALIWGVRWWIVGRFMQTTDDAYLHADSVTISPNVTGLIESVYVADNQAVKMGDPLIKVDSRTYQASLEQANATVEARKADIERAEAALVQQQATIRQAQATLAARDWPRNSRRNKWFVISRCRKAEPRPASGSSSCGINGTRDVRVNDLTRRHSIPRNGRYLLCKRASRRQRPNYCRPRLRFVSRRS